MINMLLKRRMENKKKNKKGFTLVELIVVLVIIAILAAVLVPTVSGYIGRAKKTAAQSALKNVVTASQSAGTDLLASSANVTKALGDSPDLNKKGGVDGRNAFVIAAEDVGGNKIFDNVGEIILDNATGTVVFASYSDGTYYATYNGTTNTYETGKGKKVYDSGIKGTDVGDNNVRVYQTGETAPSA
jgi:prepilin-type N-terminal cleavage/methylation domain-containing protein